MMINTLKMWRRTVLLGGVLLLGQVPGAMAGVFTSGAGAAGTASSGADVDQVYGGVLNTCRSELSLLKPLDSQIYQREERALNGDLAAATQYLLMRGRLDDGMRETLDRLYQANLSRTCQQIHNVLFSQLLNRTSVAVTTGK